MQANKTLLSGVIPDRQRGEGLCLAAWVRGTGRNPTRWNMNLLISRNISGCIIPSNPLRLLCSSPSSSGGTALGHLTCPAPPPHLYLNGVLLKDAQLQEDVQLDLSLMEQLLHLHLGVVELLQHRLDVADGATVGRLVAGHSRVPVAEPGREGRGLDMFTVTEEQGAFLV